MITTTEVEGRRLVKTTLERSVGDGWTTERLAGRLGLPIGMVARILVEFARSGLEARVDDEWVAIDR
jgi:hypothetical protein